MLKNLVSRFKVFVPLTVDMEEKSSEDLKEEVLRKLLSKTSIRENCPFDDVLETLLAREAKGSTGLGRGIAIPHARTECIEKPVVILGISPEGINWSAQDGEAVRLFFLILVPLEQSDLYLRILNRLSALVRMPDFIKAIEKSNDEVQALNVIHEFELEFKLAKTAKFATNV